eukprot:2653578-Alexandrium_andersonii.AAC.1
MRPPSRARAGPLPPSMATSSAWSGVAPGAQPKSRSSPGSARPAGLQPGSLACPAASPTEDTARRPPSSPGALGELASPAASPLSLRLAA